MKQIRVRKSPRPVVSEVHVEALLTLWDVLAMPVPTVIELGEPVEVKS